MKFALVLVVFTACLLGTCLSAPAASPDPSPEALAEASPAPQTPLCLAGLGSGLAILLETVLNLVIGIVLALLGQGLTAGCSDGGPPGLGKTCACGGRDGFGRRG
ncbi:uncharacterized protein LOC129002081 isoform X6 [Macrosteles quadrilineatus]|uniref:uncharacterized protein LOC129002081 isoform X6 n=1 Tax=Macrosteles quadrilineatus TaxID=74068 RepID=UPI0023E10B4A|nr:uncharacterized protein LOC129002081 isoform X6 [Macrosteles quadrilineatus]